MCMGHSELWVNFAFHSFSALIMEATTDAFPREKVIDRRATLNSDGGDSDGSMGKSKEGTAT